MSYGMATGTVLWVLFLLIGLPMGAVGCARGGPPQLNLLAGVAEVHDDLDPGLIAGIGLDAPVGRSDARGGGLRLGGRLTYATFSGDDPAADAEPDFEEQFTDLTLFSLQFTAAYRLTLGGADDASGWGGFIEPGIGLGPGIANAESADDFQSWEDEGVLTLTVNPFLRGGLTRGAIAFGVEVGWQAVDIVEIFEDDLRDPSGPYAGAFLAFRLGR